MYVPGSAANDPTVSTTATAVMTSAGRAGIVIRNWRRRSASSAESVRIGRNAANDAAVPRSKKEAMKISAGPRKPQ